MILDGGRSGGPAWSELELELEAQYARALQRPSTSPQTLADIRHLITLLAQEGAMAGAAPD